MIGASVTHQETTQRRQHGRTPILGMGACHILGKDGTRQPSKVGGTDRDHDFLSGSDAQRCVSRRLIRPDGDGSRKSYSIASASTTLDQNESPRGVLCQVSVVTTNLRKRLDTPTGAGGNMTLAYPPVHWAVLSKVGHSTVETYNLLRTRAWNRRMNTHHSC